ncbi:MAG: DinB family protein [Acidobacteriota bacterium]|nr:DinB family protein [Acidobacteriota bacterium]
MIDHALRVAAVTSQFDEAMVRFQSRLSEAAAQAPRVPAEGAWTIAQVAWHVGAVNDAFAKVIDGTFPVAQQPAADFVEREWEAIRSAIPEKLQAPSRVHPPDEVTLPEAVAKLSATGARLTAALRELSAERARFTYESMLGRISLYQVGEWATAHVIRHNKQVKRLLSEQR